MHEKPGTPTIPGLINNTESKNTKLNNKIPSKFKDEIQTNNTYQVSESNNFDLALYQSRGNLLTLLCVTLSAASASDRLLF